MMKLVDLSLPMYPGLLGFNKLPHLLMSLTTHKTVAADGIQTMSITFGNHMGTHIDGPAHLVRNGRNLSALPLETFYGTGVVLDVRKGPDEIIDIADVEKARPQIMANDIVLLYSGWGSRVDESAYFEHHPYLTEELARWFVAKKIKMFGMDVYSPDLPWAIRKPGHKFGVLKAFLDQEIPVLLQITNLEQVAGKRLEIMALPINFRDSDSAPARAVARID